MTEVELVSIFTLATIPIQKKWQTANNYWPDCDEYTKLRRIYPWWLVKTPRGLIHIGWRKRVISIDWSDTGIRKIVTLEDVTKSDTMVHAWCVEDAVKYLKELAPFMTQFPTPQDREDVDAVVLANKVSWHYVNSLIIIGEADNWTFLLPQAPQGLSCAMAVRGPKFVDLTHSQTEALRQHFQEVNQYAPVPIFKP